MKYPGEKKSPDLHVKKCDIGYVICFVWILYHMQAENAMCIYDLFFVDQRFKDFGSLCDLCVAFWRPADAERTEDFLDQFETEISPGIAEFIGDKIRP